MTRRAADSLATPTTWGPVLSPERYDVQTPAGQFVDGLESGDGGDILDGGVGAITAAGRSVASAQGPVATALVDELGDGLDVLMPAIKDMLGLSPESE